MKDQKELIPMLPGDLLRYEREKAGLTLESAAVLSKIKPGLLAAIESGETAGIPAVYVRGYIRNYARALGVDVTDIEDQLAQVEGTDPAVRSVFSVESERGRTEKWLKASSYLAASVVIAALAWQFTHEAVRFSQGDSELTAAPAAAEAADPAAAEANAQARPPNTHLNASIASVEVMQRRGDSGGKAVAEQAWAAIDGQPEDNAAAPGEHRLTVSTSADSWVEILDGQGRQLELDLLRAGHERAYSGPGPFRVMLGRASAVQLTLDGEPVDLTPHTSGDVARLTLAETASPAATAESTEPADSVNR